MTIVNQLACKNPEQDDLQSKRELYFSRFAISHLPIAVLWLNSAGQIIYANQAVTNLTQYERQELLSMKIADLDLDWNPEQWLRCREELKQEEFVVVESCHRTKQGQRLPVECKITSVEDRGAQYYCVWLQDITQQKQAVAIWQKSNSRLEQKVQQRTAELTKDNSKLKRQLAKVSQQLEQNREHSQINLVSLVSHELRAPLNIISFTNSLLKRYGAKLPESAKQAHLAQIKAGVQQLDWLIDTMISIAKSETNQLNCKPQKTNLEQFCRNLIAQLQVSQASQPEINLTVRGKCREIAVDRQILTSILRNLLDNAIKYSALDSEIDLILEYGESELIFQVKDYGIGISELDLPHLFKPFKRGREQNNIRGNGLGLAIVKQLVEVHQGQIAIESRLGHGTTFTVFLPLIKL